MNIQLPMVIAPSSTVSKQAGDLPSMCTDQGQNFLDVLSQMLFMHDQINASQPNLPYTQPSVSSQADPENLGLSVDLEDIKTALSNIDPNKVDDLVNDPLFQSMLFSLMNLIFPATVQDQTVITAPPMDKGGMQVTHGQGMDNIQKILDKVFKAVESLPTNKDSHMTELLESFEKVIEPYVQPHPSAPIRVQEIQTFVPPASFNTNTSMQVGEKRDVSRPIVVASSKGVLNKDSQQAPTIVVKEVTSTPILANMLQVPYRLKEDGNKDPGSAPSLPMNNDKSDVAVNQALPPQLTSASSSTESNDQNEQPVHIRDFSQHVDALIKRNIQLHIGNGISEAKITLTPENLGKVDIKVVIHDGQVSAIFNAHTLAGKDALEGQMSTLKASLASHGLNVDTLEVVQAATLQSSFQQGQRQQSQQGRNSKANTGKYEEMIEEVADVASKSHARSTLGSSFQAMA